MVERDNKGITLYYNTGDEKGKEETAGVRGGCVGVTIRYRIGGEAIQVQNRRIQAAHQGQLTSRVQVRKLNLKLSGDSHHPLLGRARTLLLSRVRQGQQAVELLLRRVHRHA